MWNRHDDTKGKNLIHTANACVQYCSRRRVTQFFSIFFQFRTKLVGFGRGDGDASSLENYTTWWCIVKSCLQKKQEFPTHLYVKSCRWLCISHLRSRVVRSSTLAACHLSLLWVVPLGDLWPNNNSSKQPTSQSSRRCFLQKAEVIVILLDLHTSASWRYNILRSYPESRFLEEKRRRKNKRYFSARCDSTRYYTLDDWAT